MSKTIIVLDQELVKEGIKLLMEEFHRLHILQISDGLKTLLDCELDSSDFLRAVGSLNDIGFISTTFHGYYKLNKRFLEDAVSKARIDKIELLKKKFNDVKIELKKRFESGN